jgi:hypothetical protein
MPAIFIVTIHRVYLLLFGPFIYIVGIFISDMPRCCIKGCPTQAGELHRFPKNSKVRQEWIAFFDNLGQGWIPGPNSRQVFFVADLNTIGFLLCKVVEFRCLERSQVQLFRF